MCGIAGYVGKGSAPDMKAMLRTMAHRGPDGSGFWASRDGQCHLGHVRLAIIDQEGGAQPLGNEDNTLQVVFNGCIYNYQELAAQLKVLGHVFRTRSDTEVIVHAYEQWGQDCLSHFVGMFAFALWDGRGELLFCARDHLGVKPFYYWPGPEGFLFGSEIKALLAVGAFAPNPDREALEEYLVLQSPMSDRTLFAGVRRLLPGHFLCVGADGVLTGPQCYWRLRHEPIQDRGEDWFAEELLHRLRDSIRLQLRSDVPLGVHLSGGLDSSAVACLTREALGQGRKLHAFCGRFDLGPRYDESEWARSAATQADATLHLVDIKPSDFVESMPRIAWLMDEPTAGPGVFPQYVVASRASELVRVVLGGQGGDEIFIGYARYLIAYLEQCLKGAIEKTADTARHAATLATIIPSLPMLGSYLPMLQRFLAEGLFAAQGERYFRLLDRTGGHDEMYSRDILGEAALARVREKFEAVFWSSDAQSYLNRMLTFDLSVHLPALLQVEDRTSMAFGLESRTPLLDHRICEFMARTPPVIKFRGGRPKHLFRKALQGLVPECIIDREDKMGFPVPLGSWLRGPLKDFARDLLLDRRARERGLLLPAVVEGLLDSEEEHGRALWGAINLELWHRTFVDA